MMLLAACHSNPRYKKWSSPEDRRRRDRRIPRCALHTWDFSSFRYLYFSDNNQALINDTGQEHESFRKLLVLFKDYYIYWTWDDNAKVIFQKVLDASGYPCGRQRNLSPIGCLGLVLMWYRIQGLCARSFSMMFGQTSTFLYKWLRIGQRVLLHTLCRNAQARVCFPNADQVRDLKSAVEDKYPYCSDCIGAA